ncbi:MAG: Holliday junction branch migration protein RuvA [Gammaproteobacteria bacterium]
MIGRLTGKLLLKQPPHILLDVHGVGYELEAPMSTFYQLPELQQEVSLHTHLVVREDAQLLYGFATEDERRWFRSLIKVNGVGARLALGILSGMSAADFARCVHDKEIGQLVKLPGVGKKTAERLIVEMRDRLPEWHAAALEPASAAGDVPAAAALATASSEALHALIALGYKPVEASRMLSLVEGEAESSEALIRAALKTMIKV